MRGGVTTVEIKSGYGLDIDDRAADARSRARCWARARRCASSPPCSRCTRCRPNIATTAPAMSALVIEKTIPAVAGAGLAQAVDAFCEGIGFTPDEVRALFEAASDHGLRVKLHAEQLSNLNGAALAARFGALSADHLEHCDEAGVAAMAAAGMVAVLLPGAYLRAVGDAQAAGRPAAHAQGVPMAIATDCNPGTSPILVADPDAQHGLHPVPA